MKTLKHSLITLLFILSLSVFKLYLGHFFNVESPILLYFGAVCFCAWYGGALQGLWAIVISVSFIFYFFVYHDMNTPTHVWAYRLVMFSLDGSFIVFICSRFKNSKMRVDAALNETRLIENHLRQNQGRLSRIFDSNMIGILFSRLDGEITQANDYFLTMVGYTQEDLAKHKLNWKIMTPPEHSEVGEQALRQLKARGYSDPFEKEYLRPDGTRVSAFVRASMVDENEVVAFVVDISDRKNAEVELARANNFLEERVSERTLQFTEANRKLSRLVEESEFSAERLRDSQNFLDSVIENIPNMIFVKEAKDLRFVRFNKAGADLLGHASEAMIGKNDYDFFPKEEADFFTAKDREVLRDKVVKDIFEETLSTPKGLRYLHTKKLPIIDKHGVAQYLLGISEDITEKKILEEQKIEFMQAQVARNEAEKSMARLEFLSEASVNLSMSLDIHVMLNAFAKTITSSFADLCLIDFYDQDSDCVERVVTADVQYARQPGLEDWSRKNLLSKAEPNDGVALVLKSGEAKIFNSVDNDFFLQTLKDVSLSERLVARGTASLIVVPLVYRGNIFGALTLVNVSPKPVFNELDLSLGLDLAKRASFAIENAKLFGKANEASRAKSAFLANISHEIRTPLGAMLGFAELALQGKDQNTPDEQSNYMATIIRNGHQLLHIVDEVLDLSKAESNQIQIEKISFFLPKIIEDVSTLLKVKAKEKGLHFAVHLSDHLPERISTDPMRLRQILINIIGNAIKFTAKGSVEVFVSCHRARNRTLLEFDVKDTGIGITAEQASIIFQPFVQADNSMTRKFGGTGLGLFLARKLARLLGGDVTLKKSAVGEGSEFSITVEAADVVFKNPAQDETPTQSKPMNYSFATGTGEPARVLIVDDSEDNRDMLAAYLEKTNLRFDMAENGLEGVEKAMQTDYDIVLMDIQMPKMDGFEAVKFLRDKSYNKPVIAITAHAMKGYRERCLDNGFDDYLCKPLSWHTLMDCLNKYLEH